MEDTFMEESDGGEKQQILCTGWSFGTEIFLFAISQARQNLHTSSYTQNFNDKKNLKIWYQGSDLEFDFHGFALKYIKNY